MSPYSLREAARVVGGVLEVDAEHGAAAGGGEALLRALEHRRLGRHGAHHEAQKFSTTTLPLQAASERVARAVEDAAGARDRAPRTARPA